MIEPRMLEGEKKLTILVVDDERLIADTLAQILTEDGFDATAAYSGEEAIENAMFLKPDVLITDVVMGQVNGIEAALRIRGSHPNCRVIVFSGNDMTAYLLDEAETKGHHFEVIAKPAHPTELLQLLAETPS